MTETLRLGSILFLIILTRNETAHSSVTQCCAAHCTLPACVEAVEALGMHTCEIKGLCMNWAFLGLGDQIMYKNQATTWRISGRLDGNN